MHIVIIGNGITGITCARYLRKLSDSHQITVISGETDYFFSRTALMYVYMGHMKFEHTQPYENWFWKKNRINLKKMWVTEVKTDEKQLIGSNGEKISYDKLLIASGSKSNKFGWKGQDLDGVQGLYSYQDLQLLEKNTKKLPNRAVIVGGGLIGIELAEMLHSRHIPVTFLVRESSFWNNVLPEGESNLVNSHIKEHGFDLRLGVNLEEIISDENGRCKAVKIKETSEIIDCELVGLTAGVSPNISFLENSGIDTDKGVLVNHSLQTNLPDIYAAGDCAQFTDPLPDRRPIEQVWYTGKMQGEVVACHICGENVEYSPGPWFNSAKFLDIEYQTYGMVMPQSRDGEKSLYWEHSDGKKCVHIRYKESNKEFVGINIFGIRCRHIFFDKILREKKSMEYVLQNLKAANFDPEFYEPFEESVVNQYNEQTSSNISLNKKAKIWSFFN